MGGRRGCGGTCSAKSATSASNITTLSIATRSVSGKARGTAAPIGAGHCVPQEGIDPCVQHVSQV